MNRDPGRETSKSNHIGVLTRSKRKSSQAGRDMDEVATTIPKESRNQKRAQIENDALVHEDLEELQMIFADFVEALNSKDNESISDRVKRGNRRKMINNISDENPNTQTPSLKRVKRESRKSKNSKKNKEDGRKASKKQNTLEPIEEDVKKENIMNGKDNSEPTTQLPKNELNLPQSKNHSQHSSSKLQPKETENSPKKQNSNANFNGKIPELAPV